MGLIYLDACLLIYTVENHPVHAARIAASIGVLPAESFAVSPLVMLECLVKPLRNHDLGMQRRYEASFAQFVPLTLPPSVYVDAASLRARFGLKTPDTLHLACAHHHGCAALWTNDDRLAQASHGLAINALCLSGG